MVGKSVHSQSREKSLKQPEAPKILGQDIREPQSQDYPCREPCIGWLGTCDSPLRVFIDWISMVGVLLEDTPQLVSGRSVPGPLSQTV